MSEPVNWCAPAKLNLFLHVVGRRPDGYHELQTLFQLLDWGDRLQIEVTGDRRVRRVSEHAEIPESEDLVVRAACLLQETCGVKRGAAIAVHKEIPLGSGLGGGSSDAATVLLVLNELWGCGLERPRLAQLGLQLGADVPVFVHGHSAFAEGVGERLVPVSLGERHYVLVFPEQHISTAEVFNDPLLARDTPRVSPDDLDLAACRNDCQPVVMARHAGMRSMIDDLSQYGDPHLTGTGSCIFLPAKDKKSAEGITRQLKCRYNVLATQGVDRSPLLEQLPGGC